LALERFELDSNALYSLFHSLIDALSTTGAQKILTEAVEDRNRAALVVGTRGTSTSELKMSAFLPFLLFLLFSSLSSRF